MPRTRVNARLKAYSLVHPTDRAIGPIGSASTAADGRRAPSASRSGNRAAAGRRGRWTDAPGSPAAGQHGDPPDLLALPLRPRRRVRPVRTGRRPDRTSRMPHPSTTRSPCSSSRYGRTAACRAPSESAAHDGV